MSDTKKTNDSKAPQVKWLKPLGLAIAVVGGLLCVALGIFGTVGEGADSEWTLFLGRFHPLILHLPIGALSVVGLLEGGRILTKGKWQPDVSLALGFAAVSSVVAVFAGFLLGQDTGYGAELLQDHFVWGCGFGAAVCFAFGVQLMGRDRAQGLVRFSYLGILALGFLGMTVAGHHGASLTHGETYLTDQAPAVVRNLLGLPERQKSASELADLEAAKPLDQQVFFTAHVEPIMESKCYQCHNENKKKGKLMMVSLDDLLKGGDEGPALVIGDASKSNMIERITLPDDDEYHMPPTGKEQVTETELAVLTAWINSGASIDKTIGELDLPAEVVSQLGAAKAPSEASVSVEKVKMLSEDKIQELEQGIAELKSQFPGALNLVSRSGEELRFNAAGQRGFNTESLKSLEGIFAKIVDLDLSNTEIDAEAVALIARMPNLRSLKLNQTQWGNAEVAGLKGLEKLEILSLFGTKVGPGLDQVVADFKGLKRIYVGATGVDQAGVDALKNIDGLEVVSTF